MRIYIAGKITGLPIEETQEKFSIEAMNIMRQGHTPVNPMELEHNHDKIWESYMKECIAALVTCDAILIMPCSFDSPGAMIERRIAKDLNMQIIY